MKKNKRVAIVTLGCPKNFVDSEGILMHFKQDGYRIVQDPTEAEVIVVNTCGFIEPAKEESIETIFELSQLKEDGICEKLIVTGCLVERYEKELSRELSEADIVIGNRDLYQITAQCNRLYDWQNLAKNSELTISHIPINTQHVAYLKIAEGCENYCSYCVIPQIRGNYRSQPMEKIVAEAEKLISKGVREINLIAQETTKYGIDLYGEIKISELLKKLSSLSGEFWIRLLYTNPATVTDDVIATIATCNNICNYIDLPVQHISDKILTAMNRHVTKDYIIQLIEKIRDNIPDVSLRTTFIVGFPGETEKDFIELVEFLQNIKFDKLGVFPYSHEEGTAAFQMANQIPQKVAEKRKDQIMSTQQKISEEIHSNLIGKKFKALIEEKAADCLIARSYRDAPEIDGIIEIPEGQAEIDDFVLVEITNSYEYDLVGKIIEK